MIRKTENFEVKTACRFLESSMEGNTMSGLLDRGAVLL
jgi:hypothetical protein